MKNIFKRYTLAVIMCGLSATGMAEDILSENFNINFDQLSATKDITVTKGWSTVYCTTLVNTDNNSIALKLEDATAYAITPNMDYVGNAVLTFTMAKTKNSSNSCSISITVNQGTINGGTSAAATATSKTFTTKSFDLSLNEGATIKFKVTSGSDYVAIDDVKISSAPTLSDLADNSGAISYYATKTINVTTERTLTGGIWNTLCLPFDVTTETMEQALGDNQDIQMRTYGSYANDVMTFTNATTVTAGTPFLIKLNTTKKNPTFSSVTINNTAAQTITHGDVSFIGTYSPVALNTDGTHLFITTSNNLASPGVNTNTIRGMRAYIEVPTGFNPSTARLAFSDDETGISEITAMPQDLKSAIYNLSGQRIGQPKHGLNIINGKLTFIK